MKLDLLQPSTKSRRHLAPGPDEDKGPHDDVKLPENVTMEDEYLGVMETVCPDMLSGKAWAEPTICSVPFKFSKATAWKFWSRLL